MLIFNTLQISYTKRQKKNIKKVTQYKKKYYLCIGFK